LLSLGTRNTDSLLGAVAKVLADEGIMLENSTALLEPLLAKTGVLSKRAPSAQERKNIEYGRAGVARRLAEYDIGQTVVIAEAACVAVEAMKVRMQQSSARTVNAVVGTTIRIGFGARGFDAQPCADRSEGREADARHALRRSGDWREDDRDHGARGATCLAVDAGRCLLLDGRGDDARSGQCGDRGVRGLIGHALLGWQRDNHQAHEGSRGEPTNV